MRALFLILAIAAPLGCATIYPTYDSNGFPTWHDSRTVYEASECIGPVINGECHGQVMPKPGYHKTCYGQWVGGKCTGPMF